MGHSLANIWSLLQTLLSITDSSFCSLSGSPLAISPYAIKMANSDTGAFSAVGAVLGYIGAEAATVQIFERLLWPQRSYANISPKSIPLLGMTPMGGPLHSVALKALDVMFLHGLFKGPRVGHMLGTAFFPDQNWTYTIWTSNGRKIRMEQVRNCLWVRALSYVPIPKLGCDTQQATDQTRGNTAPRSDQVRAKVAVSHLTLARATKQDVESEIPFVEADVGKPAFQILLAIFATEASALIVAMSIATYCQSS